MDDLLLDMDQAEEINPFQEVHVPEPIDSSQDEPVVKKPKKKVVKEKKKEPTPVYMPFKEEVYKLIHDAVEDYTYPVCFGLPAGHVRNNFPLILGANVELIVHPKGAELHFP